MQMNRIRDLREDHDLSQRDVASYLHIATATYRKYECWGTAYVPLTVVLQLARRYRVNLEYLLGFTDVRNTLPLSKRFHWFQKCRREQ